MNSIQVDSDLLSCKPRQENPVPMLASVPLYNDASHKDQGVLKNKFPENTPEGTRAQAPSSAPYGTALGCVSKGAVQL